MGEGNYLVCSAENCTNQVRRSGDRVNEQMVWTILIGYSAVSSGLRVRVGLCESHGELEPGTRAVVLG